VSDTLDALIGIIDDRKNNPQEGSYTCSLLAKGPTRILKKVGEEATEVVIAGALEGRERLVSETADLMFHLLVMLASQEITWAEVEAELRLTDRDGPVRWVVEVLKPKFKDDQSRDVKLLIEMAVELQAGHAAPKGLRTLLDEFPVLDLASFPAGTKEIRCMAGILRHGRKFGVEARFGVSPDGAPVLNQYKVEEGEGERGVAPRFVLEENPVQAVRQALAFLEKGDFKAMLRYAPERDRKRMEEMDINVEEFLARMAEEMRKRGFSTISVISQNLPRVLRVPVVMGACSFRFEFPGEARGKKGDFQIEVECYVEKPDARSWIIKDMDVDFDARELGASEGSKGEDGKGPDKK